MEVLEKDEEPASRSGTLADQATAGSLQTKKGLCAFVKRLLNALCQPKTPDSVQGRKKTAQDWRDESRAKNPWWGNGV